MYIVDLCFNRMRKKEREREKERVKLKKDIFYII